MRVINYFGKRISLILVLLLINTSTSNALVTSIDISEPEQQLFKSGQVWKYNTRNHEFDSTLTILKVDNFVNSVVVHIRLDQVSIIDPGTKQGVRTDIPHMAFLQNALLKSVTELKQKNTQLADFSSDYKNWRDGNGSGTSWAWHFNVAEALNGLEKIYQQQSSLLTN